MINEYLSIHQYRLDWLYSHILSLNLPKGARILDLGCYPTYLFDKLSAYGYQITGVSSEHEKIIQKNIYICNLETEPLPFSKNEFDLIICCEVIEHLGGGLSHLFPEINRCLKPTATFLLTTPNAIRLHNLFSLFIGRNIYFPLFRLDTHPNYRHQREYTKSELISLIGSFKFKIKNYIYLAAYPPTRQRNQNQSLITQIFKWILYFLLCLTPSRRDTLILEFTKF